MKSARMPEAVMEVEEMEVMEVEEIELIWKIASPSRDTM